jgi:hypothetical protein
VTQFFDELARACTRHHRSGSECAATAVEQLPDERTADWPPRIGTKTITNNKRTANGNDNNAERFEKPVNIGIKFFIARIRTAQS